MDDSAKAQVLAAIKAAKNAGGVPMLHCAEENLDEIIDACEENFQEFVDRGFLPIIRVAPRPSEALGVDPFALAMHIVSEALLAKILASKLGAEANEVLNQSREQAKQTCSHASPEDLERLIFDLKLYKQGARDRNSDRN